MAHVATAAFDPIFWMHHCNVERWYCEWQLKNDCITVESMNKRSGETVNGSHQIPWDAKFEDGVGHTASFPGSMRETVWYNFVIYDTFTPVLPKLIGAANFASFAPIDVNKHLVVSRAHSVGVKVNRRN